MEEARHIISVDRISKTYKLGDVRVPALKEVSVQIQDGDFLVITGRNGSGKSTLLRQLGLLDKPNSGTITLNNHEVTRMPEKKRSRIRLKHLGYIFQEYALIAELSALENVMLPALMLEPAKKCRSRAQDLLDKVGIGHKTDNLPRQLSGGEQQKVAIARALVNKPDVLFADEPTANLDSIAAHDVLDVFRRLNEDERRTIVMITHEPDEKKYASRELQLADGRVV